MKRKIIIIGLFVVFFGVCALCMYYKQGALKTDTVNIKTLEKVEVVENKTQTDDVNKYSSNDLSIKCEKEDKIFCAVERAVKCTLSPELEICKKELVPSFVIGIVKETPRPNFINFEITKMQPIIGTNNINIYTKSDCDAQWFGLCKGNVIYSLIPNGEDWQVTNIYAIE